MENYDRLTIEKFDHIALVTLNRPDRRNALDLKMLTELEHAALGFRDDVDTRAVVFTGAGKHFCAGADLGYLVDLQQKPMLERRRAVRLGERVFQAILGIEQITLCAFNGAAIGGGACLATAVDLRIGSRDCYIEYPEIDIGMNLMWQCLPRTVRLVGEARAIRLAVGGERVAAPMLENWGLLEEITAPENLVARSLEIAGVYASKPPVAAQMIKRSVSATGAHLDRAMMHADSDQHVLATLTKDHERALAAYREKREATYTGE